MADNIPEFGSTEMFHGKVIAEKEKLFKEELDKIESKHMEYFETAEPYFPGDERDHLHNHYIIYTANGTVTFNFTPHSNLDQSIKDECVEAFKRVYEGATQNPK